jgi:hypothetical protein
MGDKNTNEKVEKQYGRFDDTLTVHTAPSGTQYVLPTDLLFSEDQKGQLRTFLTGLRDREKNKR